MNILGIGLDYLMLKDDKVRGDVRRRQFDYASRLKSLTLVVYSPKKLEFKPQKWADNLSVYPTNSKNKITFMFDAFRIASRICKERKIDAITTEDPFTTGFVGYLLKRKLRVPLNTQAHIDFCDNKYWMRLRKVNRLFNKLGKFILKCANTIRVGTNKEKRTLAGLGVSENKISVIPVNSDLKRFQDVDGSSIRKHYLNGRFDKILLFTGRLVNQKDLPTLLRAFKIIVKEKPLTLLMVVGSGKEESFLRKIVNQLAIDKNVVFTGSVEHEKIPEHLSACDVYVVPSIFEGTCIAMAEAMAAGKPVVATRFAGAVDLVNDDKTGFIVNQEDYETFAEKVIYLLDNPEIAKEMGRKGSLRVNEIFSNNRNIERMVELWEETAKCGGL